MSRRPYLLAGCFLLGAITVSFAGPIIDLYHRLELTLSPPPIEVHNLRARWIGPRMIETTSDGASWNRHCPNVTITRLLLLADGSYVGARVEFVDGPLKGAVREPRAGTSITPQRRAPSTTHVTVPPFVSPEDVRYYVANGLVPDDKPCSDGWAGPWRIFSAAIDPPPDSMRETHP